MTTAASRKFLDQIQYFTRSDQFGELVEDGAVFNEATFQTALQLWVKNGGLKGFQPTKKTGSKKAVSVDGPTCCARTYNGGGCLDGKICGRKGTVMIDGVPCCPQHAKRYPGNYKGFPDKKHIPGFCSGCSALAGKDVIHDCSQIFLLGFKNGTKDFICQPVCISRAQQHTDYDGAKLGENKPKSTRGRKKGAVAKTTQIQEAQNEHSNPSSPTLDNQLDSQEQDKEDGEQSIESEDEQQAQTPNSESEWVQLECDLGTGDGEQPYWGKEVDAGYEIYTNEDDEADREKIGFIDEDGVFTQA